MNVELSHREAKSLYLALVDDELPAPEQQRLEVHLEKCEPCRTGWERYSRTVNRVRKVPRERPPKGLATLIARRARRRRPFGSRGVHLAQLHYRLPVEAVIPLLLGVLAAALLVLLAP